MSLADSILQTAWIARCAAVDVTATDMLEGSRHGNAAEEPPAEGTFRRPHGSVPR